MTDELTRIYNYRYLRRTLGASLQHLHTRGGVLSVVMVDVDNLKSYNDTLGHQRGDVVLSQIASIIDSNTRDVDKVFRYGGDEFCVLLPETDSGEAAIVAEKVRKAVSDFHFSGEEKVPSKEITISAGVASLPTDDGDEDELVRMADTALYAAKQKGRNSVAIAENPP